MSSEGVELQNQNQENQNAEGVIREERQSLVQQPITENGEGNTAATISMDNEALENRLRSLEGRSQVVLKNKHDQQNVYFIILGALITAVAQMLSSPSPNCHLVRIFFVPLFILAFVLIGIPLIRTAGKHAKVKIEYDRCALERERRRTEENGGGPLQPDNGGGPLQPDWYREKVHKCGMVIAAIILVIFNLLVTIFIFKFCGDDKHASAGASCARICTSFVLGIRI